MEQWYIKDLDNIIEIENNIKEMIASGNKNLKPLLEGMVSQLENYFEFTSSLTKDSDKIDKIR